MYMFSPYLGSDLYWRIPFLANLSAHSCANSFNLKRIPVVNDYGIIRLENISDRFTFQPRLEIYPLRIGISSRIYIIKNLQWRFPGRCTIFHFNRNQARVSLKLVPGCEENISRGNKRKPVYTSSSIFNGGELWKARYLLCSLRKSSTKFGGKFLEKEKKRRRRYDYYSQRKGKWIS